MELRHSPTRGKQIADSQKDHVGEGGIEEPDQDRKWNCVTVLRVGKKQLIDSEITWWRGGIEESG
jgi:hypothetical protein